MDDKGYVYRMFVGEEIVYIGMTENVSRRMEQHFTRNKKIITAGITKIEYADAGNYTDAKIVELWLINKYLPRLNKAGKSNEKTTTDMSIELKWQKCKIPKKNVDIAKLKDNTRKKSQDELYAEWQRKNHEAWDKYLNQKGRLLDKLKSLSDEQRVLLARAVSIVYADELKNGPSRKVRPHTVWLQRHRWELGGENISDILLVGLTDEALKPFFHIETKPFSGEKSAEVEKHDIFWEGTLFSDRSYEFWVFEDVVDYVVWINDLPALPPNFDLEPVKPLPKGGLTITKKQLRKEEELEEWLNKVHTKSAM